MSEERKPHRGVRKLIHAVDPYDGFNIGDYRDDLQGWGGHYEFFDEMVIESKAMRALEVGTWKGRSAVSIAGSMRSHFSDFYDERYGMECIDCGVDLMERDHARAVCDGPMPELVCVDTWLGATEFYDSFDDKTRYRSLDPKNGYPQVYYQFLANIKRRNWHDIVTPFPQSSTNALRFLGKKGVKFDLIYVDGSHEYDDVCSDLKYAWPLLREGGVIIGDDYCDHWSGVVDAVNEFFDDGPVNAKIEHRQYPGEKYPSDYWIVRK